MKKKLVLTLSKLRGFVEPVSLEYDGQMLPVKSIDISYRMYIHSEMTITVGMENVDIVFEENDDAIQTQSAEQTSSAEAG